MEETKTTIKRIGGYLHRVVPIMDKSGEVLSYALKPLMVEFRPRDVFQVVIGCSIMAIPVALTEEVWVLGETLPTVNVMAIAALSILFVSAFVFFNFYRFNFKHNRLEFLKRVLGTYLISILVVAVLLTIIQKCPWGIDNLVALKRIIIVSFPAVMSATLSDTIK